MGGTPDQVTPGDGTLCGVSAGVPERTALAGGGTALTYGELDRESASVAAGLLQWVSRPGGPGSADPTSATDLEEARVAFLVGPGPSYATVQRGIWRAGGVAVPLAVSHPEREHLRVLEDTAAACVVVDPVGLAPEAFYAVRQAAAEAGVEVATPSELSAAALPGPLPDIDSNRRAQILFTSGTTGRPKGVVHTHANLRAQTRALVDAWRWSARDHILHVLPLHHVHGIVNCLCCPLSVGATVEFAGGFDPVQVWERLSSGEVTVFMAVPTVYHKLVAALEEATADQATSWRTGVGGLRLAVSGSAALPVPVFQRWRALTGLTLLERYGMTEIGMALSNPLEGERRPGTVGQTLPGVEVRLVNAEGVDVDAGSPGEIEVRGPQVFSEYWDRPDDTAKAFRDGWFRTGDDAVLEDGYYRILGRQSVDILKSGGYKLSALEIEGLLLEHPEVLQCAVVGLDDPEWGQVVAVAVVPSGDADVDRLRDWALERMAPYKVPRRWRLVDALPRNAMGKVQKPAVVELFR